MIVWLLARIDGLAGMPTDDIETKLGPKVVRWMTPADLNLLAKLAEAKPSLSLPEILVELCELPLPVERCKVLCYFVLLAAESKARAAGTTRFKPIE